MGEAADVFRAVTEAFGRGGIDAARPYYHPDATLLETPESPEAGLYEGREAIFGFFRRIVSEFDRFEMSITELRELSSQHALAEVRYRARGRASGAKVDATEVWDIQIRDGVIVQMALQPTMEAALASLDAEQG